MNVAVPGKLRPLVLLMFAPFMAAAPTITLVDQPNDAVINGIRDRLVADLDPHAPGTVAFVLLSWEMRDETGLLIGGLNARAQFDWLFISALWIAEAWRGQGLGRRLLVAAETEARMRGLFGAWLDTFDFSAPGFYEACGYTCFGRIEDMPPGHTRCFYCKRF